MTTLTPDEAIQKTNDIIERYEQYWRDEQAHAELKALWGDAINDCGVFVPHEEEILFHKDGCRASISIGSAHGCYAFGVHLDLPTEGFGHAPSIFGDLYESREAARTAAIEQIIDRLPKSGSSHEESSQHRIERLREALLGTLRQPSLF